MGLVQKFRNEFYEAIEELSSDIRGQDEISIITGQSAFEIMEEIGQTLERMTGKTIYVYPIKNNFFGGQVSVAGLVTGSDIIKGLEGKPLGEKILIPNIMLRQGENVFLDDTTLETLQQGLGTKVVPVAVDGRALVKEIMSKD